jgi:hypothetical protein
LAPSSSSLLLDSYSQQFNLLEVVPAGKIFEIPSFYQERTLYFRVRLPGTTVWSNVFTVPASIHQQRTRFDKHKAQRIVWDATDPCAQDFRRSAPKIFMKRLWTHGSRRIDLFSKFWLINKTGVALRYLTSRQEGRGNDSGPFGRDVPSHSHSHGRSSAGLQQPGTQLWDDVDDCAHSALVGSQAVPLLADCPSRRLRVLPYALASSTSEPVLYLYDVQLTGSAGYRCTTLGPSSGPQCIYSDCDQVSVAHWPAALLDNNPNLTAHSLLFCPPAACDKTAFSARFHVSQDCLLFLCLDARRTRLPGWARCSGYRPTGETVESVDGDATFRVYCRSAPSLFLFFPFFLLSLPPSARPQSPSIALNRSPLRSVCRNLLSLPKIKIPSPSPLRSATMDADSIGQPTQ